MWNRSHLEANAAADKTSKNLKICDAQLFPVFKKTHKHDLKNFAIQNKRNFQPNTFFFKETTS
jgi:hypothetical protein